MCTATRDMYELTVRSDRGAGSCWGSVSGKVSQSPVTSHCCVRLDGGPLMYSGNLMGTSDTGDQSVIKSPTWWTARHCLFSQCPDHCSQTFSLKEPTLCKAVFSYCLCNKPFAWLHILARKKPNNGWFCVWEVTGKQCYFLCVGNLSTCNVSLCHDISVWIYQSTRLEYWIDGH